MLSISVRAFVQFKARNKTPYERYSAGFKDKCKAMNYPEWLASKIAKDETRSV